MTEIKIDKTGYGPYRQITMYKNNGSRIWLYGLIEKNWDNTEVVHVFYID